MIPTATLKVECEMVNPPRPKGVGVFDGDKLIAVVELDHLRATLKHLDELEAARAGKR